jgi:asparagine synthase (glutamine-hydrolysing)
MSGVLRHRGPDDSGLALYGPVGFAFRRLAILDLSPAGHQPMETPDGRLAVVFNGEIYNYLELRAELAAQGHVFRSGSDTEVLLRAYQQWGPACAERFNGMWAFVIYDKVNRLLLASRDRFGVKPLYRFRSGNSLFLASEIKAIVASGEYRHETNWSVAAKFLCRGHLDEDTATFYRGIDQIAPGTTVLFDAQGHETVRRFWTLGEVAIDPPADPVATFRELYQDAVALRMRSDVPVGVCLSGGIDSNAIIATMTALRESNAEATRLQAFSYIPDEFSEADYIQETIARTGAELNVLQTTPEQLWDALPTAMWHYDEPVHSPTALIGFKLLELARRRGVTVILNGQGADEVNAGYYPYFMRYWSDLLRSSRVRRMLSEVSDYSRAHGGSSARLAGQALADALRSSLPRFRQPSRPPALQASWFTGDVLRELPPRDVTAERATLDQSLLRSVEVNPLPTYLRVEDRNSMAHSVEARLPFLDYRLVSLAFSLPAEWKLRGGWNKFIVREAMRGIVPERVRTRLDKMGFPTPSNRWFAGAWYGPMQDLLLSSSFRESGLFHADRVRADLERHRSGEINVAPTLFRLAELAAWLKNTSAQGAPAQSTTPPVPSS